MVIPLNPIEITHLQATKNYHTFRFSSLPHLNATTAYSGFGIFERG